MLHVLKRLKSSRDEDEIISPQLKPSKLCCKCKLYFILVELELILDTTKALFKGHDINI